MTYTIELKGMHCTGCTNLIAISLEDEGFSHVNVDIGTNSGVFESSEGEEETKKRLDHAFASPELKEYSYTILLIA